MNFAIIVTSICMVVSRTLHKNIKVSDFSNMTFSNFNLNYIAFLLISILSTVH